ncbi:hypothetical protein [Roseibium aggregatum]|uniref:Uncharacterized protein n=1 Tax=Roseibium aggregatum TaxID=187304 RepID=A0A0M6YC19_9HYPH|nr:hypothetical protein [Roseibium aggregatum]CTQ47228.1 hypothetical protein LAL4801_05690 [Roseibium aggregatum]
MNYEIKLPEAYSGHPILKVLARRKYLLLSDEYHLATFSYACNTLLEMKRVEMAKIRAADKNAESTRFEFNARRSLMELGESYLLDMMTRQFHFSISDRRKDETLTSDGVAKHLENVLSTLEDINSYGPGDVSPLPSVIQIEVEGVPTWWFRRDQEYEIELILKAGASEFSYGDPVEKVWDYILKNDIAFDQNNPEACRLLEEDIDRVAMAQNIIRRKCLMVLRHMRSIKDRECNE